METHDQRRDRDRQHRHDREREHERAPREATPVVGVELPELPDGGGRRLGPGRERHGDREREQHGEHGRALRARDARVPVRSHRIDEAVDEDDGGARQERQCHEGEHDPPTVTEPGEAGHQ